MPQNPFYVYALKDPRQKPAKPFYIGKGTGNRAWEHQAQIDGSEKGEVINGIHEAGYSVLHTVIADNLTEEQALKLEAELISAFGTRKHGGLLTNKVQVLVRTTTQGRISKMSGFQTFHRASRSLKSSSPLTTRSSGVSLDADSCPK